MKPLSACLFIAAAILCGGCLGDDDKPGASDPHKRAQPAKPPAKPIYARCGTDTFSRPRATPTSRASPPSGWQVVYSYPARAARPPRRGQTTIVTLVESAPSDRPVKFAGARQVAVDGRKVLLRNRTRQTMYVAKWRTEKARYTALANGATPTTLKRIIACLP